VLEKLDKSLNQNINDKGRVSYKSMVRKHGNLFEEGTSGNKYRDVMNIRLQIYLKQSHKNGRFIIAPVQKVTSLVEDDQFTLMII